MLLARRDILLAFGAIGIATAVGAEEAPRVVGGVGWRGSKVQLFFSNGHYTRFDVTTGQFDDGYPRPIDDKTWPGLAAYKHLFGGMVNVDDQKAVIFLADGRFIVYDIAADWIDPGYPKSM